MINIKGELQIDEDSGRVWFNDDDGICRLRIQDIDPIAMCMVGGKEVGMIDLNPMLIDQWQGLDELIAFVYLQGRLDMAKRAEEMMEEAYGRNRKFK